MATPSDSAVSSDAGEISTVKEADADMFDDQSIYNDFIIDLAARGRKTAESLEKTKRLKGADGETSGLSFTTEEKENVDDDDAAWATDIKQENVDDEGAWASDIKQENVDDNVAWETDIFKEFDGLMNKRDYFDSNSDIRMEDEVINLLDRSFNEQGDSRKTISDNREVMIMPIFLPREPEVEKYAKFALDFYNKQKGKNLVFVKLYKANYTNIKFGHFYFLTIDAIDSCLMKKRFQSCVMRPFRTTIFGQLVLWSFKPKLSKIEEEEFEYQMDDDNDDGWETDNFKTWPAFSWNFFDYRRIGYCLEREEDEIIRNQLKDHCYEVRNSKGFDVQTIPPSPYHWLKPPPMHGPPSQNDIIKAARFAINTYNEKKGKELEFMNVSKVFYCGEIYTPESDLLYFITSKALDIPRKEERIFQTCVVRPKNDTMRVRFFKIKL